MLSSFVSLEKRGSTDRPTSPSPSLLLWRPCKYLSSFLSARQTPPRRPPTISSSTVQQQRKQVEERVFYRAGIRRLSYHARFLPSFSILVDYRSWKNIFFNFKLDLLKKTKCITKRRSLSFVVRNPFIFIIICQQQLYIMKYLRNSDIFHD